MLPDLVLHPELLLLQEGLQKAELSVLAPLAALHAWHLQGGLPRLLLHPELGLLLKAQSRLVMYPGLLPQKEGLLVVVVVLAVL